MINDPTRVPRSVPVRKRVSRALLHIFSRLSDRLSFVQLRRRRGSRLPDLDQLNDVRMGNTSAITPAATKSNASICG